MSPLAGESIGRSWWFSGVKGFKQEDVRTLPCPKQLWLCSVPGCARLAQSAGRWGSQGRLRLCSSLWDDTHPTSWHANLERVRLLTAPSPCMLLICAGLKRRPRNRQSRRLTTCWHSSRRSTRKLEGRHIKNSMHGSGCVRQSIKSAPVQRFLPRLGYLSFPLPF